MSEVRLDEVDGDVVKTLVKFCYSGRMTLTEENVQAILETAAYFEIASAIAECCNVLTGKLTPQNCVAIGLLAELHQLTDLCHSHARFVAKHFQTIVAQKDFLKMSVKQLCFILKQDDLNVTSEETVFHAITNWVRSDEANRKALAPILMNCIRMELLRPSVEYSCCWS